MDRNRLIGGTILMIFVGGAVAQQMRRGPEERTWQGRVAGVPYDFRRPTLARCRAAWWNRDNPSLLAPQAFGIGWNVNLYRVAHPLEEAA